jgi:hypothetical protein
MGKLQFTFDAIGRDLFPAERTAAQVFVRKYDSPPTKEVAQRQMQTVKVRVHKAMKSGQPFTTAFYDQVKKASGAQVQGSATTRGAKVTVKVAAKRAATMGSTKMTVKVAAKRVAKG